MHARDSSAHESARGSQLTPYSLGRYPNKREENYEQSIRQHWT